MQKTHAHGRFRPSPWMEEGRVEGGFAFVDSASFTNVWRAYQRNELKLVDVRSWLAMHEMVERRRAGSERQRPTFSDLELARLTGTPATRRAGGSRRRLIRSGVLEWSDSSIRFKRGACSPIGGRSRLPVPRRILRNLAKESTAADVACVLGHVARCLYYRRESKVARSGGLCKAGWVATEFGVGERSVHRSRQKLIATGWLRPVEDGLEGGRLGARFVIDLAWRAAEPGHKTAAQRPPNDAGLAAPTSTHQPSLRIQRPELSSGVSTKPDLRNVVLADLKEPGRLGELFDQAASLGYVRSTDADRLSFEAAAERAKRCGDRNPGAFFATLVRRGLWGHLCGIDEDRALAARRNGRVST